jgi:hypothetical protein
LLPRLGHAQITEEPSVPFPDPEKFSHGLYAEGEIGAVTFLGRAGDKIGTGVAVGARLGYDLARWISVQAHVLGSTHEGGMGGGLEDQLLQVYQATGELKLTYTFRQLSLFASGGGGVARMGSNLLTIIGLMPSGSRTTAAAGGGGGFDWHTLNRHFSAGVYVGFLHLVDVRDSGLLATTVYLRYTF